MSDSPLDPQVAARLREALELMRGPSGDPAVESARRAGEVLRSVIDRLTATSAPPEVLDQIVEHLKEVDRRLGPYDSVRRYVGSSEASGLSHDRAFFDWSPLFGRANPIAPPVKVTVEDDRVVGWARFGVAYEGPPGCVHGGFIAAAFDEILGLAQSLSGRMGMTGTLTVRYRRPTPLNTDLRMEGRVESVAGRKVTVLGSMFAGDLLTAEATGLFVAITPEYFLAHTAERERSQGGGPDRAGPSSGAGSDPI